MMRILRQWIMDALGFSRQEANGILLLVVIILCVAILPKIYLAKSFSPSVSFRADQESLDKWANELHLALGKRKEEPAPILKTTISKSYSFDPNTATKEQLIELGFGDRVAQNLVSYRESGGSFTIKADLKRIYGISEERVDELWAYISLPETRTFNSDRPETKPEITESKTASVEPVIRFSLNEATADQLQEIRGIGPAFSERIVKYRDQLGGFQKAEQLYEVYGLDSVVADRLIARSEISGVLNRLSINTDSAKFLYQHPYIDYKVAYAIINYRHQHGDYNSVEQLQDIKIISDSLYKKISPYLSIDR